MLLTFFHSRSMSGEDHGFLPAGSANPTSHAEATDQAKDTKIQQSAKTHKAGLNKSQWEWEGSPVFSSECLLNLHVLFPLPVGPCSAVWK